MPKTKPSLRAAIYARVSTDDRGQDPETQLRQLRQYAKHRGFAVVEEFVDNGSGRDDTRPQYQKLFGAVRKRHVDVVLCWRYDRFARSTQALINALKEFERFGVNFISYQENVDTTTPQGEMVFNIMASLAQFESSLIGERVKAGMQRARAQGKHVGRPPLPDEKLAEIKRLLRKKPKPSIYRIAKDVGVNYETAWRYVRQLE
jgi:DNA invertase Pin-like site-specific DNA recombinase